MATQTQGSKKLNDQDEIQSSVRALSAHEITYIPERSLKPRKEIKPIKKKSKPHVQVPLRKNMN